jgi:uncharacterized protein
MILHCSRCGKELAKESRYRPFCSERCKTIDLGKWISESYRVPEIGFEQADDPLDGQDEEATDL